MSEILTERYKSKTDQQLVSVIENNEKFIPEAVKIAMQILDERGVDYPDIELEEIDSKPEELFIPTEDYRALSDEKIRDQYSSQNITIKGVGTYFVLTGLTFLGIVPDMALGNTIGQQVFVGLFSLLFLMLMISGIQLFRKRSSGLIIGIFALLPFMINFGIPGFIYQTGTFLNITLTIVPPISFNLSILNSFFVIDLVSDLYFLKIDIVPIIAFFFLFDLYGRIDDEEIDEIWYKS